MVLLILMGVCPVLAQTEDVSPEELLQSASNAYEAGDYSTAAALFEAAVDQGARGGIVYFNLANAYYQMGDLGNALLNYRRAQEFFPRDVDLEMNLARIRAQREDIQGDTLDLLDGLTILTTGVLTLRELGWITLGLWNLWFGLLLLHIIRPGWRDSLRAALVAGGLALLVGVILLGSRLYTMSARPEAVVIDQVAWVMSGPGENYLRHFELHAAAEMRVLEARGNWVRFTLPDGRQGWIRRKAIETVTER